jgi:hypothetical protein
MKLPVLASKWAWKKLQPNKLSRPLRERDSLLGCKLNRTSLLTGLLTKLRRFFLKR